MSIIRPTKKDHVADTNCKVYDFDNLYVGGQLSYVIVYVIY